MYFIIPLVLSFVKGKKSVTCVTLYLLFIAVAITFFIFTARRVRATYTFFATFFTYKLYIATRRVQNTLGGIVMFAYLFSLFADFFYFMLGISSSQSFPPPLSAEKENEYFLMMEKGDDKAREELIVHNLRLVSHIVRKYYASSPNQEDLVSIGTIGLIKAVDSFNAQNGARFATYAAKCIQNTILS